MQMPHSRRFTLDVVMIDPPPGHGEYARPSPIRTDARRSVL